MVSEACRVCQCDSHLGLGAETAQYVLHSQSGPTQDRWHEKGRRARCTLYPHGQVTPALAARLTRENGGEHGDRERPRDQAAETSSPFRHLCTYQIRSSARMKPSTCPRRDCAHGRTCSGLLLAVQLTWINLKEWAPEALRHELWKS